MSLAYGLFHRQCRPSSCWSVCQCIGDNSHITQARSLPKSAAFSNPSFTRNNAGRAPWAFRTGNLGHKDRRRGPSWQIPWVIRMGTVGHQDTSSGSLGSMFPLRFSPQGYTTLPTSHTAEVFYCCSWCSAPIIWNTVTETWSEPDRVNNLCAF